MEQKEKMKNMEQKEKMKNNLNDWENKGQKKVTKCENELSITEILRT